MTWSKLNYRIFQACMRAPEFLVAQDGDKKTKLQYGRDRDNRA